MHTVVRAYALCVAMAIVFACGCSSPLSDDELLRRTSASYPTWQNYPEDIKAQVGAGPVAEWNGEPQRVWGQGGSVYASFQMKGSWSQRGSAIPILMQEPTGGTYRNAAATRENGMLVYRFDLPEPLSAESLAWVQLKYPHGDRRMTLPKAGQ